MVTLTQKTHLGSDINTFKYFAKVTSMLILKMGLSTVIDANKIKK